MDQFTAEWLQMERNNHSRLLYQLKRELATMRRDAPAPTPSLPRPNEANRPSISDRPAISDRPSTDERPVVRTSSPTKQVMYR